MAFPDIIITLNSVCLKLIYQAQIKHIPCRKENAFKDIIPDHVRKFHNNEYEILQKIYRNNALFLNQR
ncbi:hypothetical protein CLA01_04630 [Chryseobacterium lathyri]|uniref:Uncharacterized protein n=1 Tax=Chryseobacterium lathyri TaxID=395933 RepID=A0A511Y5B6_9FLAO|nr:hypothetical protein CLA01_04630 [Chryseobacterium lathyri]